MDFVNGQIERWRRTWTTGDTGLILGVFTATLFVSAVLLFSVQPMFAKMVLPKLGGSPSVWAVSMCFFQAVLLAGYCYAHLLSRYLPLRWIPARPSGGPRAGHARAANRPLREPRRAAGRRRLRLADRDARSRRRTAVFRRLGQRAAAAGVVRPHRPSARERPLLPLWRLQSRQPHRASRLSDRDRALQRPRPPGRRSGPRASWP